MPLCRGGSEKGAITKKAAFAFDDEDLAGATLKEEEEEGGSEHPRLLWSARTPALSTATAIESLPTPPPKTVDADQPPLLNNPMTSKVYVTIFRRVSAEPKKTPSPINTTAQQDKPHQLPSQLSPMDSGANDGAKGGILRSSSLPQQGQRYLGNDEK